MAGDEMGDQPDEDNAEAAINEAHDRGFAPELEAKFKEFAASPLVYDMLIDALAPSIWENHDVKKGILC